MVEVNCEHCGEWFKSSMFGYVDLKTSTIENCSEVCPHCKKQTIVENKNMRQ